MAVTPPAVGVQVFVRLKLRLTANSLRGRPARIVLFVLGVIAAGFFAVGGYAAFAVPGAPKEPLDEIPLANRATQLAAWLEQHRKPTDANVKHWLFQHEWIVQGAKFGWWHGPDALQQLIKDDRRAEALWGIGAKSEQVARAALAEVEARKG